MERTNGGISSGSSESGENDSNFSDDSADRDDNDVVDDSKQKYLRQQREHQRSLTSDGRAPSRKNVTLVPNVPSKKNRKHSKIVKKLFPIGDDQ